MKLKRDEFQRSKEQHPLELFRQGIRSKQTLEKYQRNLKLILTDLLEDILEGSFEERISQLVKHAKEEPGWTRDLLLSISKKLRERTTLPKNDPDYLSPNSIDNYFKPIKKLFDMNDIAISWPRIYSKFPELENISGHDLESIRSDQLKDNEIFLANKKNFEATYLEYPSGKIKIEINEDAKDKKLAKILCSMNAEFTLKDPQYIRKITVTGYKNSKWYKISQKAKKQKSSSLARK